MGIKRSFSWKLFAVAFVISGLLFALGVLLGLQISQQANAQMLFELEALQSQTRELELFSLLQADSLEGNASKFCSHFHEQLGKFGDETAKFGVRLEALEKKRGADDPLTKKLRADYSVMEIRDFLLIKQLNSKCEKRIPAVIYFYTNIQCPACTQQGLVLRELKRIRPDVQIYQLNSDLDTPVIGSIIAIYEIKEYPSLLVGGAVLGGFQPKDEILAALENA